MENKIISGFKNGVRLDELARRNSLSKNGIRDVLLHHFGKEQYIKMVHRNGGKVVADKLRLTHYRQAYKAKMSLSVKKSLNAKLEDREFRKAWTEKARVGSRKGTAVLKEKMNEPSFYEKWKQKCRLGGVVSYKNRSGIHRANKKLRRRWSLLGLKNTGRKASGPKGERMYNSIEVKTARAFARLGLDYTYEKLIPAENKNGFLSVDFVLSSYPGIFIEVTNWDKPEEKTAELHLKFALIRKTFPDAKFVVVVPKRKYGEYRRFIDKDINLFTPIQLTQYLSDSMLAG